MNNLTGCIFRLSKANKIIISCKPIIQKTQISKSCCNLNIISSTFVKHNFPTSQQKYYSTNAKGSSDELPEYEEIEYQQLVNRYLHMPDMGHQVLVIQPYVKWGPSKKTNTTPDLQLEEATALISTLSKWKVIEELTVPVDRLDKKFLFGTGNLDKFKKLVKQNKNITAIFISVNFLKGFQRRDYEKHFRVPVFDRYSIVIQIFKEHAISKTAKLQVSLAQIPYVWAMLNSGLEGSPGRAGSGTPSHGSGETYIEASRRVLTATETKIKNNLKKVQEQRNLSRKKRNNLNIPVVAIVGYTNAGKTSLIKSLTGDKSMEPRDHLFATLDVTAHEGTLPCRLKLLYIDTVGFMSDLPTKLLDCFLATLEDVLLADVIVHVCDLSHPDVKAQVQNVFQTLRTLGVPQNLMDNMITVGNKIDKDNLFNLEDLGLNPIKISALNLSGIGQLEETVEAKVLAATQRQVMIIRVPSGQDASRWLHKETAVVEEWPDPKDNQYMMTKVVISQAQLSKFKNYFLS